MANVCADLTFIKDSRWFRLFQTKDNVRVYHQTRGVGDQPNPPRTGKYYECNHRVGGYADYRPGYYYIPADEVRVGD